jgi:hypothetical protein
MVFEKLKATFLEDRTHTRFISRKVGFSRRCPSKNRELPLVLYCLTGCNSDALVDLQKASKLESLRFYRYRLELMSVGVRPRVIGIDRPDARETAQADYHTL